MIKIIFLKDARPLSGEFLEVTERYSFVTHTDVKQSVPLGEIDKRPNGLWFIDFKSNVKKKFKKNEFKMAIEYGLELFRERNKRKIQIKENSKF